MNQRLPLFALGAALLLSACGAQKTATESSTGSISRPLSEEKRMEVDFLFFNAQKEKLIGNFAVAENLFLEIIKREPSNHTAYYEVARCAVARQQFERALEYSRKASTMKADNPWYLRLEIDLLRQSGRNTEAIPVMQRLATLVPDEEKDNTLYELATAQGEAGQYAEGIKTLNQLEARNGPSPELADLKRQFWLKLGKPDKAIEEIRRLAEAQPLVIDYRLYLGQLYFEKGDYTAAAREFEVALKQDPDNGLILLAMADAARAKKDNDKAFYYLRKAFTKPEVEVDTKIQVLLTLFGEMEKNPESKQLALELGETATKVHPDEPKTWAMYADLLYHNDKMAEARSAYQQAISTDKGQQKYTVWQQYLLAIFDVQDFKALSPEADKAVELFPNQPLPYFLSGLAKNQLKEHGSAVKVLKSGLFYVGPNRDLEANYHSTLGDAYNELKQFAESDQSYEKALQIQPQNVLVMNNWAYYLSLRKEKLDKAEELIKKAVKAEPRNPSYLDTYAWVMYQQGKYKEALEWMELALTHAGNDRATLYEHYGDILYRLGQETKALEYWRKAKEAGINSEFIDRKIADGKLYE